MTDPISPMFRRAIAPVSNCSITFLLNPSRVSELELVYCVKNMRGSKVASPRMAPSNSPQIDRSPNIDVEKRFVYQQCFEWVEFLELTYLQKAS
jgi:hypothetical protein